MLKGNATGYFIRGGRESLTNLLNMPVLFVYERNVMDNRPWTDWQVFYPNKEPEIKDLWQNECLRANKPKRAIS